MKQQEMRNGEYDEDSTRKAERKACPRRKVENEKRKRKCFAFEKGKENENGKKRGHELYLAISSFVNLGWAARVASHGNCTPWTRCRF